MDMEALVEEIMRRVSAQLENEKPCEACSKICTPDVERPSEQKPKLLVLAPEHGTRCHRLLEDAELTKAFRTECALQAEHACRIEDYEAVVLYGLTNEALAALAGGMCLSPYTKLAQQAILCGKQVFLPEEEVELFRYQKTAPPAYYRMLLSQLEFLQRCGVTVGPESRLKEQILSRRTGRSTGKTMGEEASTQKSWRNGKKKVLTERDVREAERKGEIVLEVRRGMIVTDLAKEYAAEHQIVLKSL